MFKQIELDYAKDALEPYIDALTVETHYGKHHVTYTNNFNAACEKAGITSDDAAAVLADLDSVADEATRTALRNNGGGYYNHNLYFANFSANPKKAPEGKLAEKINEKFGSLEKLIEELSSLAATQFGSGWAWLSVAPDGSLVTSKTGNQDNPISLKTGNTPIIALDVWEHAYYLKYKNVRPDYIKAFFEILDWGKVEALYEKAAG
ncbi:MAG: superoxide dismutase [Lachnospiraceae bacterium]|nr:superoxide dismutase [Lachnospiraceae bacterium]